MVEDGADGARGTPQGLEASGGGLDKLRSARLVIGTPTNRGFNPGCVRSLWALRQLTLELGIWADLLHIEGDSLVCRARNNLVHTFLKGPGTHLMQLDDDIEFDPRWVIDLLRLDLDVVGGTYPLKRIDFAAVGAAARAGVPDEELARYASRIVFNPFTGGQVQVDNGVVEVRDVPTGFTLVKRGVFESLISNQPESLRIADERQGYEPYSALYQTSKDPLTGRELSEDYHFSRMCQAIGIKTHLYLPAACRHHGSMVFESDWRSVFRPVAQPVPVQAPQEARG